jgi:hypothetical protein
MDERTKGDDHMNNINKWIAIGLASSMPLGLAAEDPAGYEISLGTVNVLVIDEASPLARDFQCERAECVAFNRAVLTAHTQKVSALHERGRWM